MPPRVKLAVQALFQAYWTLGSKQRSVERELHNLEFPRMALVQCGDGASEEDRREDQRWGCGRDCEES